MGVRMLGGVWGRAGLRRPYAPEASSPIHISGLWAFDAPGIAFKKVTADFICPWESLCR